MPNSYNDTYDGIGSGQQLSAEKMTKALNLMEKVANKVETGTLSDGNTSAQYPSAKVVWDSLKEAERRIIQDTSGKELTANKLRAVQAQNYFSYGDAMYLTCKAVDVVLQRIIEIAMENGIVERMANKVNTMTLTETDDNIIKEYQKYPSAKAVWDSLQSFTLLEEVVLDEDKFVELAIGPRKLHVAKYETTQGEFEAVMGYNPSYFKGDTNLPVENVTWYEAVQYCLHLTLESDDVADIIKDRIRQYYIDPDTCKTTYNWNDNNNYTDRTKTLKYNNVAAGSDYLGCYHLPVSDELEYLCRGGTTTTYIWGNNWSDTEMNKYAWYSNNSSNKTHVVGQKEPNAYGLYDVLGNVWELGGEWGNSGICVGGAFDDNKYYYYGHYNYNESKEHPKGYIPRLANKSRESNVGFRVVRTV
ncbi:hypothetical protein NO2_1481 [Candidatus Termititenax persephonae]|uniref:Sulfatase-modifying factor enzyme-like domain-containing protein n=1 Tax=Candidatus Termititenax persephonae TaxID=2218525 RepID=A0A388TJN5_9BACT|nr:hypothetical protein NO2_1481 [Candidatus Termititenax persephonae]